MTTATTVFFIANGWRDAPQSGMAKLTSIEWKNFPATSRKYFHYLV
jgi:hypothetical protein